MLALKEFKLPPLTGPYFIFDLEDPFENSPEKISAREYYDQYRALKRVIEFFKAQGEHQDQNLIPHKITKANSVNWYKIIYQDMVLVDLAFGDYELFGVRQKDLPTFLSIFEQVHYGMPVERAVNLRDFDQKLQSDFRDFNFFESKFCSSFRDFEKYYFGT